MHCLSEISDTEDLEFSWPMRHLYLDGGGLWLRHHTTITECVCSSYIMYVWTVNVKRVFALRRSVRDRGRHCVCRSRRYRSRARLFEKRFALTKLASSKHQFQAAAVSVSISEIIIIVTRFFIFANLYGWECKMYEQADTLKSTMRLKIANVLCG